MLDKRNYDTSQLPINEDLSGFAPPYESESYTDEQKRFVRPFFSNLDRPVYVVLHLPEEVSGALSSRYSRSVRSMRQMFWAEYAEPVLYPEKQKDWDTLKLGEREAAQEARQSFVEMADFLNSTGGMDKLVRVQRARNFFKITKTQFGDDSVAEESNVHAGVEQISEIGGERVVDKRIGISQIRKSSRYVSFSQKRSDGHFGFIVPGEIKDTDLEAEFEDVASSLFQTYADLEPAYLDYIKNTFSRGNSEPLADFNRSRSAKRYDDIRDLLPFATQTNFGLNGNARAYEDLITNLLGDHLGEVRWWGQALCRELKDVIPSLVDQIGEPRGAEGQRYRYNVEALRSELVEELLGAMPEQTEPHRWVKLLDSTPDADQVVLAAFLFKGAKGLSLEYLRQLVADIPREERYQVLGRILGERNLGQADPDKTKREVVRTKKPPREWELAHYLFEFWGRAGDFRDLHRHRANTERHQSFTTKWGFDLEREMKESPFADEVLRVLERADALHTKIAKQISPDVAQYIVPFGAIQHWYWDLSAREMYWVSEIRTGSQGRPHYREVIQQAATLVNQDSPALFQGMKTDYNDYRLSRRESEQRISAKLEQLGVKRD